MIRYICVFSGKSGIYMKISSQWVGIYVFLPRDQVYMWLLTNIGYIGIYVIWKSEMTPWTGSTNLDRMHFLRRSYVSGCIVTEKQHFLELVVCQTYFRHFLIGCYLSNTENSRLLWSLMCFNFHLHYRGIGNKTPPLMSEKIRTLDDFARIFWK